MPVPQRVGAESSPADRFLEVLADPARSPIDARDVAVVVAHPDDETIGCGAQLPRLRGVTLMMATDGAPRSGHDAQRAGFAGAQDYADERAHELRQVLEIAQISAANAVPLGFADQTASLQLVALTRTLVDLFTKRNISTVLTHAYEGGHPDHDATAFAVHAAARLRADAGRSLSVIEMPFYRAGDEGWIVQRFAPLPKGREITLPLSDDEQRRKQQMLNLYVSQRKILGRFGTLVERFRRAPAYDFTELPNDGRLLYERYDWGLAGAKWLELARAAERDLGLGA